MHGHSIGRRFVVGLGITALLVLGVATNASAEPTPPPPACGDFDVTFEVLQNNLTERTFIRGDETIVRTTGVLKVRLVNTESEEAIVRNISGPVQLTFHADGSVTQVANGPSLTFLEEDVERGGLPVGPVITYGRVVSRFEEGTPGTPPSLSGFSVVSVSGRYESVCSTLA
jgi:hypothetical protein